MASDKNDPVEQKNTHHMVRVTSRAYWLLQEAYTQFCKRVAARPDLFPLYAGRRITMSEVLALCVEGQLATGGDQ